jgi:hypothetical protein
VIVQEGTSLSGKELKGEMSSLTDDDDDMKALRAYCLKIETIQRAKKSCDPRSDKSAWFYKQKPLNAIDRDDSASWKLQASLFKMHFNRNGKVRTWCRSTPGNHTGSSFLTKRACM